MLKDGFMLQRKSGSGGVCAPHTWCPAAVLVTACWDAGQPTFLQLPCSVWKLLQQSMMLLAPTRGEREARTLHSHVGAQKPAHKLQRADGAAQQVPELPNVGSRGAGHSLPGDAAAAAAAARAGQEVRKRARVPRCVQARVLSIVKCAKAADMHAPTSRAIPAPPRTRSSSHTLLSVARSLPRAPPRSSHTAAAVTPAAAPGIVKVLHITCVCTRDSLAAVRVGPSAVGPACHATACSPPVQGSNRATAGRGRSPAAIAAAAQQRAPSAAAAPQ